MDGREFKDAIFTHVARIAGALGSPKRVEIIDLLAQCERSVESIAACTAMSVANTSRHLQVLRGAGLVTSRRDRQQVVYRVTDSSVVDGYRVMRALAEDHIAEVRQLAQAFFSAVDGAEPIDIDELSRRAQSGDAVVIDVRPRPEFEAGHIPGALSIPLDELSQRIDELPADAAVVAYCRGPYCVLAAQAVAQLRAAGFSAQRLAAGPRDWRATGRPLAAGAPMDSREPAQANAPA